MSDSGRDASPKSKPKSKFNKSSTKGQTSEQMHINKGCASGGPVTRSSQEQDPIGHKAMMIMAEPYGQRPESHRSPMS